MQYFIMLRRGVMPIPPESMAIFSCSPLKVKLPYGPENLIVSPFFRERRALENSWPVSLLVTCRKSSVGLLERAERLSDFALHAIKLLEL